MGLGATAFPLQESLTKAMSVKTRAATPSQLRITKHERGRHHGWHCASDQVLALAATQTSICDEDINATCVDTATGFPDNSFNDVSSSSSPSAVFHETTTPSMSLIREGTRLNLSSAKDQSPISLLDGLSADTWTTVKPPTALSSSTSTPSSFSSLVLQTQVPSVAIQSLSLGNFLASSDAGVATASSDDQHKHKFLAASRLNRYWMGPKFGGDASDCNEEDNDRTEIPVDTQYLLVEVEREEGPSYYAVMMPLVDGGYRSSLEPSSSTIGDKHDDTGHRLTLVSYSESGDCLEAHDPTATRNALYVAIHDDPYELLKFAFREVSGVLNGSFKTLDEKTIPSEFVNSFGWCSWDAFYSKVHPSGILDGIKCLSDAGVPVKNVILDDGWQQVSPPYLHQQEDENKKKTSLAASLSLSGSSDIMPPPNSMEVSSVSSSGSAAAAIAIPTTAPEQAVTLSSAVEAIVSSVLAPLETLSDIGGSVFGVIASGVTKCYQKYVEKTPFGSFPSRLWTFVARHTPLNYGLWEFFDSETDFGRQLNDFTPNWKFLEETEELAIASDSVTTKKNMDLKELVGTLKQDWKVNKVYCWHSIHGYWRGVSDELGKSIGIEVTQVKTRPSDHVLRIEPEMAYDPPSLFGVGLIGKKDDLTKFYKHLHEPLVAAGVDGVKIDVQSGITAAGMRGKAIDDCPPMAKLYTETMEDSVSRRFPSASDADAGAVECINCMCHSTENLYRYKATAVARASDDFYPARPESHSVHLVNVAYNSMFLGEICLPDWDMFQSQHASAELHAAARSVGGCPVYVSDKPGNHNVALLQKLVLPDGSVLRAKKAGRPTRDCIFADVGKDGTSALKIWNVNRESSSSSSSSAKSSGGVLGAFNVQGVAWDFDRNENQVLDASPSPVKALVRPHDVDSLRQIDGPFAVWSHRTKSLEVLSDGGSTIETTLDPRDWEIFTVQPVQEKQTEDPTSTVRWAPIGLGHMLNSGGAILDVGRLIDSEGDGDAKLIQADITTRGPGYFVSYCHPRPSSVLIRHGLSPKQLEFTHDPESGLLEFDLPSETLEGKAHLVTVVWEQ